MFGVRIHGRGGQGVVTAAELLSVAAFDEGQHAQAFPSFGSERTGAPVVSFCRIDAAPIRLREPIIEPDAVIIADSTLLHQVGVFSGLSQQGFALISTSRTVEALGIDSVRDALPASHVLTLPAKNIALKHIGKPFPNAVLLGGFAAMSGLISLDAVTRAILDHFPGDLGARNAAAASEAYEYVAAEIEELSHATAN